jgi:hypothetical protein
MIKPKTKKSTERNSLGAPYRKKDRALAYDLNSEDPEEVDKALDALAVAHDALAFEWTSGSKVFQGEFLASAIQEAGDSEATCRRWTKNYRRLMIKPTQGKKLAA